MGKVAPSELVESVDQQTAGGTTKATLSRSDGRKESVEGSCAFPDDKGTASGFSDLIFGKVAANASSDKGRVESDMKPASSDSFKLGVDLMASQPRLSESAKSQSKKSKKKK